MSAFILRPAAPLDGTFLADMLVDAANWHATANRTRHEILAHPSYRRHIAGWMRPGDAGIVAELQNGQAIGATWLRTAVLAPVGENRLPELVIGVRAPYRAQGVGRELLRALCAQARSAGHQRISLNVHEDNPAVVLYRSEGFEWHSNADGRDLMVRSLG